MFAKALLPGCRSWVLAMNRKKSFALRIDPKMHDALQRWADDELRSINAQIEWALRDALRRAKRWPNHTSSQDDADNNSSE